MPEWWHARHLDMRPRERPPSKWGCPVKVKGMTEDFPAFFARTGSGMIAKAILLSGHRQEAEDAVQEAYTEALRSWHRIGAYDSPEAWVYKVMSQRLWAASRRAARQVPS